MKKRFFSFMSLGLALTLTACNSNEVSKSSVKPTKQYDLAKRSYGFKEAPNNVAVLSSGDLDIVRSLGGKIVGRPTSIMPTTDPELKDIVEIGNIHQPKFEEIASVKADVLFAGKAFANNIDKVESQGTKVVVTSGNSINEIKQSITLIGNVLNKDKEASVLTSQIDKQMKEYGSDKKTTKALIVYGAGTDFLIALPTSLSGDVLDKVGGENIASEFTEDKTMPGYAQISAERIIEKNPDVIFMISHGDPEATKKAFEKQMLHNKAWSTLNAVKKNQIIFLPPNLFAVNPGTGITEALKFMNDELVKVQ
ncbi:ABC transporter substrate-binding protein [Gottfriedia sp. NPDC056225]|uniref:ABC transporter substrate-binding protein n=1 Tax=Gottfriedia sp. NPDC056225 TaxID=3345751 RepID=UPI0035DFA78D